MITWSEADPRRFAAPHLKRWSAARPLRPSRAPSQSVCTEVDSVSRDCQVHGCRARPDGFVTFPREAPSANPGPAYG